jgi:hypothetical protein
VVTEFVFAAFDIDDKVVLACSDGVLVGAAEDMCGAVAGFRENAFTIIADFAFFAQMADNPSVFAFGDDFIIAALCEIGVVAFCPAFVDTHGIMANIAGFAWFDFDKSVGIACADTFFAAAADWELFRNAGFCACCAVSFDAASLVFGASLGFKKAVGADEQFADGTA